MLFGASMLTVLFGMGTNKLTAMLAGKEGIALIGVYRNLTTFVVGVLSLGLTNVVVQRISTTPSDDEARRVIAGAWQLLVIQVAAVVVVTLTFSGLLSRWLVGDASHAADFRVALLLIIGVLAMQLVVEVLNGRALIAEVAAVNVSTSALTMLLVYPLLRLGRIGLSMIIGLTCVFGAVLGAVLIRARYRVRWRDLRLRWDAAYLRSLPISLPVAVRTIVCTGAALLLQGMINRHYGTESLGLYNAAATIESTSMLLLMSGMRSYYLPKLGEAANPQAKNQLSDDVLRLLLGLLFPALAAFVLLGPWLLWLLFARSFAVAGGLIAVFAFAIIAETFLWSLGFFVAHQAAYRVAMILDCGWACLLVALVWLCLRAQLPIGAVAVAYTLSVTVHAIAYLVVVRRLYDPGFVSRGNAIRGVLLAGWTGLACFAVSRGPALQIAVGALTLVLAALIARSELVRLRSPRSPSAA